MGKFASFMKGIGVLLLVAFVATFAVVFYFRYDIFQYSAESIIKKHLPKYVHVDRIIFDLQNEVMQVRGFGIKNPRGFQSKYLAMIDTITCRYKMQGKNILDGIEVTDIEAMAPVINIERRRDGRLNLMDMGTLMRAETPAVVPEATPEKTFDFGVRDRFKGKSIADFVKLTNKIKFENGKLVVVDKAIMREPYYLTFEKAEGRIILDLTEDYTDVISLSSRGSGLVGGDPTQVVGWNISMNPRTTRLTMSNRIELNDVDVTGFRPYYDWFSPIDVLSGRMSGTLVIDFDEGNIGSMNELVLTDFRFRERSAGAASGLWSVSISDLIRYLQSSPGRVVFDFKIKGTIQDPEFFPGPRVKKAMQRMVVNQVTQMLTQPQDTAVQGANAVKSDTEKVMDVLRGIMSQE